MKKTILGMALIVAVIGGLISLPRFAVGAEQVSFSLAVGQSVTVANYTLQFTGVAGGLPYYDLYRLGSLVAHLPSNPIPPNPSQYGYQNLFVETTAITTDGMKATGTINVM